MANLVISAAGAAVGYFIGGPTGASIGWTLGSALGPRDKSGQVMSTPTVGDLRVQTSQYGVGIPVVVGKQRVAGNIFWAFNSDTTRCMPYPCLMIHGLIGKSVYARIFPIINSF